MLVESEAVSKSALPQMDSVLGTGKGYDPIHELMRAMILRAVEDFNSGGELREDALNYFYAEDDDNDDEIRDEDEYVLSFGFICRHLGMDPEKTRHAIINAKHRISTRRRAA
jgi:hypothetical protein